MLKKLFSLIGGMFLWVYATIKMRSSGEMVYRVVSGDSGLPLPKFRTVSVSYTHLDVYKRQPMSISREASAPAEYA